MAQQELNIARIKAGQVYLLRSGFTNLAFLSKSLGKQDNKQQQALNDIANSFSRFAAYQQTAFDSGAARSSSGNDATSMQRLVERAITQVLGRATGRGANSFVSALNSAFPTTTTSEGQQVLSTPSRSVVSLYSSGSNNGANGTYPTNGLLNVSNSSEGYVGIISIRQANLYRQASIIAGDALRVLEGLTPFGPEAEADQVEALRALIRADINALVEEFGRVDEPREARVLSYFSALETHIDFFGRRAFLNVRETATVIDETQVAGFELLKNYRQALRSTWNTFSPVDGPSVAFSLSQSVERANILLPTIAQVNADFEAAMDSVGFTESERRSPAAKFSGLRSPQLPNGQSTYRGLVTDVDVAKNVIDGRLLDITVYDLTEWVDRFANLEAPRVLADSGIYGLDFVTDQADRLSWVVAPIVAHINWSLSTSTSASLSLEQILSSERVRFALNDLLGQLNSLAELSVSAEKENLLGQFNSPAELFVSAGNGGFSIASQR